MSALVEHRSLEADIADVSHALYQATDAETALRLWTRLRELIAQRTEAENRLFLRETHNGALTEASPQDHSA